MANTKYTQKIMDQINTKYPGAGITGIYVQTENIDDGGATWLLQVNFEDGTETTQKIEGETDNIKVYNVNKALKQIASERTPQCPECVGQEDYWPCFSCKKTLTLDYQKQLQVSRRAIIENIESLLEDASIADSLQQLDVKWFITRLNKTKKIYEEAMK